MDNQDIFDPEELDETQEFDLDAILNEFHTEPESSETLEDDSEMAACPEEPAESAGESDEAFAQELSQLLGDLDAKDVEKYYEKRAFDVFLNTSQKEGVPVSIMEAMRWEIGRAHV